MPGHGSWSARPLIENQIRSLLKPAPRYMDQFRTARRGAHFSLTSVKDAYGRGIA